MRHEKYIIVSSDKKYVRVRIRSNGVSFSKTFVVAEFPSLSMAMKAAVMERDNALALIRSRRLANNIEHKTFADVYAEMKELYPKRVATISKYDKLHRKYMASLDGLQIDAITAVDIMGVLNKMISVASDNTIKQAAYILSATFKTARVKHYISVNPMDEVTPPKSEYIVHRRKATVEPGTVEQVVALLNSTKHQTPKIIYNRHMIALAVMTLYYTGMRPAECFALSKEDIDMENRTIHIRAELGSSYTEKNVIRNTKTDTSDRIIPFVEELAPHLQEALNTSKGPYVFSDYSGDHFDMFKVQCIISNVCHSNGIDFSLYMLRHQFSTDMIASGSDPRTLQELMGHSSFSMTAAYARSNETAKRKALAKRNLSEKNSENV